MKKPKLISVIILLAIMTGCVEKKKNADDLITIDVTKNYPEKELILQDFLDIEYIPLETNDDFITQGIVAGIGKDLLLTRNRGSDGNIFVFDRTGKGVQIINRFGQGSEEYSQIISIILDEDKNEMFVVDRLGRKIMVYDLYGNFKRVLKFADTSYYYEIFNYDKDHLICYKGYSPTIESEQSCHLLISKQDGKIIEEIKIPTREIVTPVIVKEEFVVHPFFHQTSPNHDNWTLIRTFSDTIYNYSSNHKITPFIVRTPSIHTMIPEVFLFPSVETDHYHFMYVLKKELDERMKMPPNIDLMYDKQEKAIFKYRLYNNDYTDKKQVYFRSAAINHKIVACQALEAFKLIEDYQNGKLKGRLKEIAETLNEESNAVIMLVKHRENE